MLGSVGEPINPVAWKWYHSVVGEGRCPIADTWWQTETGGFMVRTGGGPGRCYCRGAKTHHPPFPLFLRQITPMPGAWPLKPGSATLPFFGVQVTAPSTSHLHSSLQKRRRVQWLNPPLPSIPPPPLSLCGSRQWWMRRGRRWRGRARGICASRRGGREHSELCTAMLSDMRPRTLRPSPVITSQGMAVGGTRTGTTG